MISIFYDLNINELINIWNSLQLIFLFEEIEFLGRGIARIFEGGGGYGLNFFKFN